MVPSELHDALLDALLDCAWQQWTSIGVAGIGASTETIVDPEALLVATLEIGRSDPRLFDEMLDWFTRNASVVDAARLARLVSRGTPDQRRLAGVAARLAAERGAGPTIARLPEQEFIAREGRAAYGQEPLFRLPGGSMPTMPHQVDASFAAAGYVRGALELRGMSRSPDGALPTCLRFRARALVGPGPRAEALTYLWTHEWAHGREIAARTAYGQAPVAAYLASLAEGGLAERRTEGRRTLYRLAAPLREVGKPAPAYVDWVTVWPALVAVLAALQPDGVSEDAAWMRLHQALDAHGAALRTEGLETEVGDLKGWAHQGPEVLARAVEDVIARVRAMR